MNRPQLVLPQQQSPSAAAAAANANSQHYPSAASMPSRVASAPVPSPTTQRPQFFSSLTTSTVPSQTSSATSSAFAAAAPAQNGPQYQYQYQAAPPQQQINAGGNPQQGFGYMPERGAAGSTAQETRSYIDNFALVAEAAKRAQMAVLMRDMEGVELT